MHKADGLRPGFQRFKAQRVLDALEGLLQLGVGFVQRAGLDQEAHIVKTGFVVGRVSGHGLVQHLQGRFHIATGQRLLGFVGTGFRGQRIFAGQVLVQKFADLALRLGAHKAIDRLATNH